MILYDSFLHERSQKKTREPMSSDSEMFVLKDGRVMAGSTDWERLDAMTDEEVTAAALYDTGAPPRAADHVRKFSRLPKRRAEPFLTVFGRRRKRSNSLSPSVAMLTCWPSTGVRAKGISVL